MVDKQKIKIYASILGADLSNVQAAVTLCEKTAIDGLHLDIMDGHFVPQLTFGTKFVSDIKKITKLHADVHLMVNSPDKFLKPFIDAGADSLSLHIENDIHIYKSITFIKENGIKAGVCIIPSTPVSALSEIIDILDYVQVMTVNPGFSGQKIIKSCINKIYALDTIRKEKKLSFDILVDGGVNRETSGEMIRQGANILITASAFFNSEKPEEEVLLIRNGGR